MPKLIENHTTYTATFRMLAKKHKELLHLAGGADDIHFVRCVLSKHPMLSQGDLSEFLKSLKHKLQMPFMLLVAYSGEYGKSHNDAKRKTIQGEFMILDRVQRGDWAKLDTVLDKTEKIGEEILAYLVDYYDENPGDGIMKYEEGMSEKISNTSIDSLAGTKFYFSIDIPNQVVMQFDEDNFNDLTIE